MEMVSFGHPVHHPLTNCATYMLKQPLMTDEAMIHFNMKGTRSGKYAFRKTAIFKVVIGNFLKYYYLFILLLVV